MKSFMNERLNQTLVNLRLMEKNCSSSKKGFSPSPVVCMYLTECILPIVDIYPVSLLHTVPLTTSFNNSKELIEFLDTTIGRMKRAEAYTLSKEEIESVKKELTLSTFTFLFEQHFEPRGQLEKFLRDLLERLTMINDILNDPRRNQAKLSYLARTTSQPINQIASVLEALSIGIANV